MSEVVVHIAQLAAWVAARKAGVYLPPGYAEEGFIHLSRPEQAHLPANAMFSHREDLVLLWIDAARLNHRLKYERPDDSSMAFPHLYGPLNLDAVIGVSDLEPWEPGEFVLPPEPH